MRGLFGISLFDPGESLRHPQKRVDLLQTKEPIQHIGITPDVAISLNDIHAGDLNSCAAVITLRPVYLPAVSIHNLLDDSQSKAG